MRLQFVKLGGSLITDKTGDSSLEADTLHRLAGEIAAARRAGDVLPLVIGHGSGSFGHLAAAATALRSTSDLQAEARGTTGSEQEGACGLRAGVNVALSTPRVQAAAHQLHRHVIAALLDAGVPCFSFPTSSWLITRSGVPCRRFLGPLHAALGGGLVPVICGDVVFDQVAGAAICSTESAFAALVESPLERAAYPEPGGLEFARAIWLGRTDGLFDASGATIARIDATNLQLAREAAGDAAGTDVTGGMRHRLEVLWQLGEEVATSWVLDGTRDRHLQDALLGRRRGGTAVERRAEA